jgi:D-alanyl-lipoteichoic acid acyltransferase DltB (MBOAT superfamily)
VLFHSLEYAIFLVVVFLVYWAIAKLDLLRIVFLLVASLLFYACANPWFVVLLAVSIVCDYTTGLGMGAAEAAGRLDRKKRWLVVSLVVNLGLLGVFKYTNFFYGSVVSAANLFGAGWVFERLPIILPAGISFYTFQSLSYSIDVYRGKIPVERSFLRFAFFVAFFPQLVAGPIVRASDFLPQVPRRPFISTDVAGRALFLIAIGLAKKVVLADYLAINLVDRVFEAPHLYSSIEMACGLYAYTMQVYLDFSAYTDIAIGSGLLFGFSLPENFDRPYLAVSVADFWRRWHKTLGSWLRDYLYYPLGGSRGTTLQTYRNLFITFLLIGLWHGAAWTFVAYGSLHATGMCVNRYFRARRRSEGKKLTLTPWGRVWRIFVTLHFLVLARILFRSQSFEQARRVVSVLLRGGTGHTAMTPLLWVMLLGSYLVHFAPRSLVDAGMARFAALPAVAQGATFALATLLIKRRASSTIIPFVYFKF